MCFMLITVICNCRIIQVRSYLDTSEFRVHPMRLGARLTEEERADETIAICNTIHFFVSFSVDAPCARSRSHLGKVASLIRDSFAGGLFPHENTRLKVCEVTILQPIAVDAAVARHARAARLTQKFWDCDKPLSTVFQRHHPGFRKLRRKYKMGARDPI